MRIIFLNTAQGRLGTGLFNFIKKNSKTTDIICFQEANEKVFPEAKKILSDFVSFRQQKFIPGIGTFHIALFTKKEIFIKNEKNILNGDTRLGLAEIFGLSGGLKDLFITNVHGIPQPGDKKDNPARLRQSREIIEVNSNFKGPRIIGGDFNLLPDTQSVKMFEEAGFINLITKYRIKSTRNSHAWNQAREMAKDGIPHYGKQSFADYIFVSPEVKVKNFEVPEIEISDHLPLILDFEI